MTTTALYRALTQSNQTVVVGPIDNLEITLTPEGVIELAFTAAENADMHQWRWGLTATPDEAWSDWMDLGLEGAEDELPEETLIYIQVRGVYNLTNFGPASNIDSIVTPEDVTEPILTLPTNDVTGSTTADVGVTTDGDADGVLYLVVSTSATAPTAQQVKDGEDIFGSPSPPFVNSQSIDSEGVKTFPVTGLTPGVTYYPHFMHEDASGNKSAVVTGSGLYYAQAFRFDGANDYMRRVGGFSGAADSKVGLGRVLVRINDANAAQVHLLIASTVLATAATNRFRMIRSTGNSLQVIAVGAGLTTVRLNFSTGGGSALQGVWYDWIFSFNMANSAQRHNFLNGNSISNWLTYDDNTLDFTYADWSIGAQLDGTLKGQYDLAQFAWWQQYLDLSQAGNMALFRDANGNPQNPAVAIAALGTPLIAHYGDLAAFHTNKGSGGGMTLTGALVETDSPSE